MHADGKVTPLLHPHPAPFVIPSGSEGSDYARDFGVRCTVGLVVLLGPSLPLGMTKGAGWG